MNLPNICCTCLRKTPQTTLISHPERGRIPTTTLIQQCTSVHIPASLERSAVICDECKTTFWAVHTFKQQAIHALDLYQKLQDENGDVPVLGDRVYLTIKNDSNEPEKRASRLDFGCEVCHEKFSTNGSFRSHVKSCRREENVLEKSEEETGNVTVTETVPDDIKRDDDDSGMVNDYFDDPLFCNICAKTYKNPSAFNTHKLLHRDENPYKCEFCRKFLPSPSKLRDHILTHTGERPHICDVCGKSFAVPGTLRTHMRLHTARPFTCTICQKGFCRMSFLNTHMRSHTGHKPYLCPECGQAFYLSGHLKQHLLRHSDARPFECDMCHMTFKQPRILRTHKLTHAKRRLIECAACTFSCNRRQLLQQHVAKVHASSVELSTCAKWLS